MSTLNRGNLEEEFGIQNQEPIEPEVLEPIEEEDSFEVEWNKDEDTESVLRENIERANAILNQVEEELRNGNFSARLVEVAGQILNSVTNSVKEINTGQHNKNYLLLREKVLKLKKFEIDVKRKAIGTSPKQNLIIADRESVLKFLDENKKEGKE